MGRATQSTDGHAVLLKDRPVAIFNLSGEYFALFNRCPHQGGSLCESVVTGLAESDQPGEYRYDRTGEIIRCPWHGWEFDIRTGKSYCAPGKIKTRMFPVQTAAGIKPVEQKLAAETVPVEVENDYLVVEA